MSQDDVAALILAAGESSRMGQDKALLEYRGKTFLAAIIDHLREAQIREIAVVLGHHAELIQAAVDLSGVRVVLNPDYKRGQTSSLQAGLAAWDAAGPRAVLLCLVDHPAVGPDVIRCILEYFRKFPAPVTIPVFRGKRGHPVLLGQELFAELMSLPPQEGANTVIRNYGARTKLVEVDGDSILADIDDPEAYRKLAG
jgi:molybdenum cofactor cytidylyltransferase